MWFYLGAMQALVILLLLAGTAALGIIALVATAWIGRPRYVPVHLEAESPADPVYSTVSTSGWTRPQA